MRQVVEEVASKLKTDNDNDDVIGLNICQIDCSLNDIGEDLEIIGYPTLLLWTKGTPYNKPIEFDSPRNSNELLQFL